jgi:hypothetical protein
MGVVNRCDCRQGVNDVPERTWFDDQDRIHGANIKS